MKIGFVQFEPRFGEIETNIKRVEEIAEKANADLLVLPELFNTGYVFTSKEEVASLAEDIPAGKTTKALCRIAREKKMLLVGGLVERSREGIFNSAVLVSPQGYVGTYRKIHLFFEETLWFQPGNGGFQVYETPWGKIGIMICFDWFFPESMRVLSLQGARVVCHCANLVLPFCQEAMKTRCLENRVFAVTSNRIGTEVRGGKTLHFTGKSQIAAPDGSVLYRAGEEHEELGVMNVDLEQAGNKALNAYNDLFRDRKREFYRPIVDS